jgi:membrane-bound metal-dependent hydrolase YbcI (DUF457 family)
MPSPVGHGLAGLVLEGFSRLQGPGRRPARGRSGPRSWLAELGFALALVFAANAPDLDFIPGILIGEADRFHHGPAHSLGAAVLFGLGMFIAARLARARRPIHFALWMALAFSSHLFLDMFSLDKRPPNGVPLLWPLTDRYFVVAYPLFLDIQRTAHEPNFLLSLIREHNLRAMFWELVIMGLVLAVSRLGIYAWQGFGGRGRVRTRAPEFGEGEA